MESLKLTTIKVTHRTEERPLEEGITIAYYGNNRENFENPWLGYIKQDDEGFYIVWEDESPVTRIDKSFHSESIIKNCGFF